jgi:hypothetical protein
MRLNFYRRYKWAFRPEYDEIEAIDVGAPKYSDFLPTCSEMVKVDFKSLKSSARRMTRCRMNFTLLQTQWNWQGTFSPNFRMLQWGGQDAGRSIDGM